MPSIIIVGAGPGLGLSVARRFQNDGYAVAVIARRPSTVAAVIDSLNETAPTQAAIGFTADSTIEPDLLAALDQAVAVHGVPDVLLYNAGVIRTDQIGDLTAAQLLHTYAVNVVGAASTAGHVGPLMAARGSGTILITGGMGQPSSDWVSLSLGKFGVRTLTTLLAQAYGPSGVHVGTIAVTERIAPDTAYDPDVIADLYAEVHAQQPSDWDLERIFTPTSV